MSLHSTHGTQPESQGGFSATELLIAVHIVGVLAALALNAYSGMLERARLARCMDELRGIQASMWHQSDHGRLFPNATAFWENYKGNTEAGPYVVLVDGNPAEGGIDLDTAFSQGTGSTGGGHGRRSVEFVVVHPAGFGKLAEYVYIEDSGPPTIVTGPENDPGYRRFAVWDDERETDWGGSSDGGSGTGGSGGSGGSGGGSAGAMVGWGASDVAAKTEDVKHGWIAQGRDGWRPGGSTESGEGASRRDSGSSTSSRIAD
jgi:prepilin-type N-terminal cleavage/methylation domain-containing protein